MRMIVSSWSPSDIEHACNAYDKDRDKREQRNLEEKWQLLFQSGLCSFTRSLHKPSRVIDELIDAFSTFESKKCISRTNFIHCIKNVYIERKMDQFHNDEKIYIRIINRLYSSFDVLGRGEMDWRTFVFMLQFAIHPDLSSKDHLKMAFQFLIGNNRHAKNSSLLSSVRLGKFSSIIYPLVRTDRMIELLELIDNSWFSTASVMDSSFVLDDIVSTQSILISYNIFLQMIEQPCISKLFTPISRRGKEPLLWWVDSFEERFYPETVLSYIRKCRMCTSAIESYNKRDTNLLAKSIFTWKLDTERVLRSKRILTKAMKLIVRRIKTVGFHTWRLFVLRIIAGNELQRVARGLIGRIDATIKLIITESAILIQSQARCLIQKVKFAAILLKRDWAVKEIQRHIRGIAGRRLAINILLSHVGEERMILEKKKKEWMLSRMHKYASKIQNITRMRLAERRAKEELNKRRREQKVKEEMENYLTAFKRKRKIFEQQMIEYYESAKNKWHDDHNILTRVNKDGVKIRLLRRKLENTDRTDKLKNEAEKKLMLERQEKEQKIQNWMSKAEERCKFMEKYAAHCLTNPDNSHEKKYRSEIKNRIKIRMKDVLRRADERCIEMEFPEATRLAEKEVIHMIGKEEREKVKADMEKDLIEMEKTKEKRKADRNLKAKNQQQRSMKHSLHVISAAVRRWKAVKTLRQNCFETYEKLFDTNSHEFYYRNLRTGVVSWSKPKIFGCYDLSPKDEYQILRDDQGFPYYYNPYSMDMTWSPPPNYSMCEQQVPLTWWSINPTPEGQCENFATRRTINGIYFCEKCWENRELSTN